MIKHYHLSILVLLFAFSALQAQEIKFFGLDDFNLRGNVKTCQVITDYGQEIFDFDPLGRLVLVTTKYNDEDKDVTSYKFDGELLVEKKLESYKNNTLDLSSSMAHFFTIDSTANIIVKEQIISYDKEFVEFQEYQFDDSNRLVKIMVSHEDAVDEIIIEYTSFKNESTKSYFENGIIQKSIRESIKKDKRNGPLKVVLTKTFLDGEPNIAEEKIIDESQHLLSKEVFQFDVSSNEFVSQEKSQFEYDDDGFLKTETIFKGNSTAEKNYIFQFDSSEAKNWVKKIVTPENSYTTRRIEYYPQPVADLKVPE